MKIVAALHQNLKHSTWLNHHLGNSASALVLSYWLSMAFCRWNQSNTKVWKVTNKPLWSPIWVLHKLFSFQTYSICSNYQFMICLTSRGIVRFSNPGVLNSSYLVDIICPRDVTTGATGATEVAPKFSDTLTLSQQRGADSAHHCRGRS